MNDTKDGYQNMDKRNRGNYDIIISVDFPLCMQPCSLREGARAHKNPSLVEPLLLSARVHKNGQIE